MTEITLTTVRFNVANDPEDFCSFPTMSDLSVKTTDAAQVRRYAGGRLRAVRRTGQSRTIDVTLPFCSSTQRSWVEEHVGQLLCVRDDRGRKIFGVFTEPSVQEARYSVDWCDITLSVQEVTHSEEV